MLTLDQLNLRTRHAEPVVRELPADLETPVSVYLRLAGDGPSFLLESLSGGEQVARYSFIGIHPRQSFVIRGRNVERHAGSQTFVGETSPGDDPLDVLRDALADRPPVVVPGLPRFVGGLAGYLSYETMRFFEPGLALQPSPDLPDAIFLQALCSKLCFDHLIYLPFLSVPNVRQLHINCMFQLSYTSEKPITSYCGICFLFLSDAIAYFYHELIMILQSIDRRQRDEIVALGIISFQGQTNL